MEKIYKLLQSSNEADFRIGLELLLQHSEQNILQFFRKHGRPGDGNRDYQQINVSVPKSFMIGKYICTGDEWGILLASEPHLRIRRLLSMGRAQEYGTISKEEFLNGTV